MGPTVPGPVSQAERIVSLDVLRGFAVMGILVMNIQSFSMPGAAYMNPTVYGDLAGANYVVWYVSHLLADMKFMSIFSMLFGAGILVMTRRAETTGRSAAGVHYRRMAWLLLFGLLHAHLLWYGDILYFYALCGVVAFLFRRLPAWVLIVLGIAAVSLDTWFSLFFQWALEAGHIPADEGGAGSWWNPPPETIDAELADYRGGWLGQLGHRVPTALFFETFLFLMFVAPRAGGLMLFGMALHKMGVFSARRSRGFYLALVLVGAVIGVPLIAYGVQRHEAAGWDVMYSFYLGGLFNYWASILVALGWVGAVMLVCKTEPLRALTKPLAAVGQMALTNYLGQTIICTTIFYGHGFGLFGSVSRVQQILIVAGVLAFGLIVSPIWLRFFRFGPFEWLWRSLTYLRLQPMQRETAHG
jgi:uncharacterized protein